ncbi:hypothetical protein EDB83DRAFT_2518222 [Lactarius deliciosus]|nr:hypothetical protein EDB83DRAFT_2518222 [Lactarius deliciosus]
MAESSAIPATLLSAIQETSMPDNIQTLGLHPFSSSSDKTIAFLHSLLDTTARVAHSVTLHSTTAVNDSRTVSLLREQSTGQHLLHLSYTQVAKTISAAQERRRPDTWYDSPSNDSSTGRRAHTRAHLPEPTVYASYAGSAEGRDSPAMVDFFSQLVSGVSKGGDERRLRDALGYIMRLDELAAHEGNGGARWFSECVPSLDPHLPFSTPSVLSLRPKITRSSSVPLDVRLLRDHALSLPYRHSPTLCFHVYLSPRAYLSLQRSAPATTSPQTQPPTSDIPFTHLYNCLSGDHPPIGVTHPLLSGRPSFPLAPNAIGFSYDFPLPAGPDAGKYGWVLGFGAGIVISQSRMLEIARAVQPQELSYSGTGPRLSFMTGSWVDMPVSPTNMHPPLRLTLTPPDEPGFLLERVQVYNMQEAWAVLGIVREQCWLNEVLNGIAWMPEVVAGPPPVLGDNPEADATEEDLRALLSGTFAPLSIPVNVYVASAAVVMTFPERPPMPGMVSLSVLLNGPAGATVEVQGAMGADVQMRNAGGSGATRRRAGIARVWAASQTAP